VDELSNELQDEALSKILKQSAETVGLYGQDLIMEVKNNPSRLPSSSFWRLRFERPEATRIY